MRIPRNRLSALLVGLSLALIIALAIATVQWHRAEVAQVTLQAHSATELFKSEPQKALLLAMRSAYKLKVLADKEQKGKYPTTEPIVGLQNILNNLQARVDNSDLSIHSTNRGDRLLHIDRMTSKDLTFVDWLFHFLGGLRSSREIDDIAVVYDLQGDRISKIIKSQNLVQSFSLETSQLSPDSKSILLSDPINPLIDKEGTEINVASLWDLWGKRLATFNTIKAEKPLIESGRHREQYKFSSDSQYIVAMMLGLPIHLWDRQGKLLAVIENQPLDNGERPIFNMLFSPDSKSILMSGFDGISLWNLQGKEISTFKNPQIPTNAVQFSADGKRIFSYHVDGTVNWWNLQGERLATFKVPQLDLRLHSLNNLLNNRYSPDQLLSKAAFENIDRVALSPDGRYIAARGYRYRKELGDYISGIQVWDLAGNELAWLEQQNCSGSLQFIPDSQRLATGNTCLWDWQNNQLPTFKTKEKRSKIADVQFSPDGKYILTIENLKTENEITEDFTTTDNTTDNNYSISLWNLQGERLAIFDRLGEDFNPNSVFFSPKGDRILTQDKIWNLKGDLIADFPGWWIDGSKYPISRDGKYTVTMKYDEQQTSVTPQISDLSGKTIATLPKSPIELWHRIAAMDFSPKNDLLLAGDYEGLIRLWNLQGKEVKQFQTNVDLSMREDYVYFTSDGDRIIIFGERSFELWDLAGNRIKTIDKLEFESESGTKFIEELSFDNRIFDRNSERFLTSGRLDDKTIIVLGDINGKAISILPAQEGEVWPFYFSSDGKRIFTLGDDYIVRVWNIKGEQITQYKYDGIYKIVHKWHIRGPVSWTASSKDSAMALSPDGTKIFFVDPQDEIPRIRSVDDLEGLLARGCDLLRVNLITGGAEKSDLQMCGIDPNKALH
jgi:WD40 repeat protein